ncbi:MAG: hypothetical protein QF389_09885, partial [Planctomycetota bacterium]|nr:hypothetical protein [Planctomycetota bacterium]
MSPLLPKFALLFLFLAPGSLPGQSSNIQVLAQFFGYEDDAYFGSSIGIAGDIDGDGIHDFFIQHATPGNSIEGQLVLISGANLSPIRSIPRGKTFFLGSVEYPTAAGINDADGDSLGDLVITREVGQLDCLSAGISENRIWTQYFSANPKYLLSVDDLNGDNIREIHCVIGTDRVILDGATGSTIWTTPLAVGDHIEASVLGDLTGDGAREIAFLTADSSTNLLSIKILSGLDGSVLVSSIGNYSFASTPRNAGDLNLDGVSEFVWSWTDSNGTSKVEVLNGSSLGSVPLLSTPGTPGSSALGGLDFNLDSIPDIVEFGVNPIRFLSGLDGSEFALVNDPNSSGIRFGHQANLISLGGNSKAVIVASPETNSSSYSNAGAVLLFGLPNEGPSNGGDQEQSGGEWTSIGEIEGLWGGDWMGWKVAGLFQDINGDGFKDFLVSAPQIAKPPPGNEGKVFAMSGADFSILYMISGSQDGEGFGLELAPIGDMNQDGIRDFLVGSPCYLDSNGIQTGRAGLFSGIDGSLIFAHTSPSGNYARFGAYISDLRDINGDGAFDYCITNPSANSGKGEVTFYSGANHSVFGSLSGEAAGDGFGEVVATIGDVDDDSIADFAIGAPLHDYAGTDAGRTYLYSGATLTLLQTIDGENAGDFSGATIRAGMDFDRDGSPDLLIGEPGYDVVIPFRGTTLNGAGRTTKRNGKTGASLGNVNGDSEGGAFGNSSGYGDHNGDGSPDISGGSPTTSSSIGGPGTGRAPRNNAGMVTVYNGIDDSILFRRVGENANDQMGHGLAEVGDLNGDGRDDLVYAAPFASNSSGSLQAGVVIGQSFDPWVSSSCRFFEVTNGESVTFDI